MPRISGRDRPRRDRKTIVPKADVLCRMPDVQRLTGLGRSRIYEMMAEGTFPEALQLGPRAVGWRESEIIAWQQSLQPRKGGGRRPGPKRPEEARATEV
jgi:prophage regulatory protein